MCVFKGEALGDGENRIPIPPISTEEDKSQL